MSDSIQIQSATKQYYVKIVNTPEFLENIKQDPFTFFVIDKNVYDLHIDLFKGISSHKLHIFEALEENKTIETALDICEKLVMLSSKRNTRLVSVGGGIVQDVTGAVANLLYRGIKWTYLPTTLLASCDSCIGGKTSLNYKSYKNLLGTFFPPDEIYIYPNFFLTLTRKDLFSGIGEIVKFNIISGEERLIDLEKNIQSLIEAQVDTLKTFVLSSLLFKKRFIEIDEFDKNERIKLNFAHTFGHAIEVVSQYNIPHGTAVALGVVAANNISVIRGIMSENHAKRIEQLIKKIIIIDVKNHLQDTDTMITAMHKDKKQTDSNMTVVLLDDTYDLSIVRDVAIADVKEALDYLRCFL